MAFDQATRGRLQRFVNDARRVLEEEFTRQLQNDYGLDPSAGTVAALASLRHINDAQRETARILRDTLAHYTAGGDMNTSHGLDRIVREQAFTVLNRLAALRMAEARGLLVESVGNGLQAKGFQLYARLASTGLGETGDAYRVYLFSVFDEFAQDLPGLFDRHSPQGRLFPREAALLQVLSLINEADIAPLWSEDETIGWIYQYFNSKEERKAMRDASQAPRNSRELAVRNQFFTPRYVVEFLVDNTLGRLWFNATGGQTGLRDRCQYLLVKPDEQPPAIQRLRDPRTLRLLDPACGSMHFGLYAFDLFLTIYREAWDWEQAHSLGSLDVSTQPGGGLLPLCQTYADRQAYLRDVPHLIIEHNIYGVDIDPRAAQIASLALWLRAQRAWHEDGIKAKDRPLIGRGQVVAAIAPPAERELRQRLAVSLDQQDAELFEKTLQVLKDLPELGLLLQVERELPRLIRQVYVGKGTGLFAAQEQEKWQHAEVRLRQALTEFSRAAESTYVGRLFAEDALQGLRMIDLARQKFDCVLMNPPFGSPPQRAEGLKEIYPNSGRDIYAMFVERAYQLLRTGGLIGALFPRTGLFIETMSMFRKEVLIGGSLSLLADLGKDVLDDATVRTACYVLGGSESGITCLRIGNVEHREAKLKDLCRLARSGAPHSDIFEKSRSSFVSMPASAIAYWIPQETSDAIKQMRQFGSVADIRQGIATGDNFRFLRSFVELSESRHHYSPYSKGGEPVPFFSDEGIYVKSQSGCAEMKAYAAENYGSASRTIKNEETFYCPGITYSQVNDAGLKFRLHPKDAIYDMKGPVVFLGEETSTLAILALLNSSATEDFMRMTTDGRQWHVSALKGIPYPSLDQSTLRLLESLSREALAIRLGMTASDETSHTFVFGRKFEPLKVDAGREQEVLTKIDELVWSAYGVNSTQVEKVKQQRLLFLERDTANLEISTDPTSSRVSIAVGVAFGRFDLRLATGGREAKLEIDPFAALPSKSPGMLPEGVDPFHVHSGILVDDQGNPHDLARLVEEVLVIAQAPVLEDVRRWLRRDFFPFHLQLYSKSGRRRAPIYWPLSTASGSYTIWVYYPSLSSQTLYSANNDFVDPKLKHVGGDLAALRNKGSARTRDDEKQFEALQVLERELIELRDSLLKLAPTYKPNQDDGVQISAAPLWPLFRHKPWQKLLKETWAKLEKGDYDWAHLAMNYWPDRVREKCKTDKSLAIAHGLESLYVAPEVAPRKSRSKKKGAEA